MKYLSKKYGLKDVSWIFKTIWAGKQSKNRQVNQFILSLSCSNVKIPHIYKSISDENMGKVDEKGKFGNHLYKHC